MRNIITLFVLLMIPFVIKAQDNSKEDISKTIDLTEVTVKADKIESKLQETPISVSMIEVKKIEDENITTLSDLSAKIPNFFVLDYGSKLSPPVFIRGMGLRRDASPSVGLYVDNIPYLEKGSFNFDFVDVQSIEVLRGPQGTLYGRNTMGGLIKIYTQDPKAKSQNYFKTDFATYGANKSILHINQPLSSKFYSVFNFMYAKGEGFFENKFNNRKADAYENYAGRLKLAYRPNNDFKATLSIDFDRSNQLGYPYANYNIITKKGDPVNYNRESSYDRDQLSIGLNIEKIFEKFVLSSSTSYQLMKDDFFIDQDFSPIDLYYIDQAREHHTIYQELNLHSKGDTKFKWLIGAMYFKQFTDKAVNVSYGDPFIAMMNMPFTSYSYIKTYDQPTSGYALYGQSSYTLGDFTLTGGLRIDFEKADLDYAYTTYANGAPTVKPGFASDLKYDQLIPKASLAYKPCEFFTSYLSVTKGFKAGGFNSSFESDDARTFTPEYSWNYEFGIKSSWINKRITANLSLFYIDIYDQQVLQPVPSGQGAYVSNAGKSYSKGIELELNGVITDFWQVWASYGFVEAKFLDYVNSKGDVLDGNYIPNIPWYTYSIGTNLTADFKGNFIKKMQMNLSYQHMGKQYWEEENIAEQESYGLTNAKITFESNHFDIGLWAKNMFNVDYNAFYFTTQGKPFVQLGKPSQFGIFAKIKF